MPSTISRNISDQNRSSLSSATKSHAPTLNASVGEKSRLRTEADEMIRIEGMHTANISGAYLREQPHGNRIITANIPPKRVVEINPGYARLSIQSSPGVV
jgi:hypothetical protein